jgi:hypothetical protein
MVGARGFGLRVQLRCPSDRPARCRVSIASSSPMRSAVAGFKSSKDIY